MDRERLLKTVTGVARVGLVVVAPGYRYLFANEAYAEIFGLDPSRIVGRHVYEVLPLGWPQIQPRLDRALAGEQVAYELRMPGAEGEAGARLYSVTYEPTFTDGGERCVVVVVIDITERRRTETAMRDQRQRLEGIVASAMDGIISIDESQHIVLMNPAAERMFGCPAGDVLGKSLDVFLPAHLRTSHATDIGRFGASGVLARAMGARQPLTGVRCNGEHFPLEASISQIDLDGRRLYTVVCRDLTERERDAAARRVLEAQLQQSQKMEAFGQLAGGVAHDFNNLLTVIAGYCDMLLLTPGRSDDDRETLSEILAAGERAAALTRQLLAFSRQQVLEPRLVDLNAVLLDVNRMLRRLIGEDITLELQLQEQLGVTRVDPRQVEQVVMNLAVNARDAMPHGGTLTIETAEETLDESFAGRHPGVRPGRFVRLTVRDTGCGMSEEIQRRIFEPFFTTKGVGKGTGLGLSVVHGIIEQSGGTIDVESALDRGTSFAMHFPIIEDAPSGPHEAPRPSMPRGSERILLVEDEPRVRALSARVLRSCGYTVLTAASGEDAIRVADDSAQRIDLLLTDVVMPRMGGRQVAEVLTASRPGLKVMYVSGYTEDAIVRHGVEQSRVAYLEKPFSPSALARRVRDVLDATPARELPYTASH